MFVLFRVFFYSIRVEPTEPLDWLFEIDKILLVVEISHKNRFGVRNALMVEVIRNDMQSCAIKFNENRKTNEREKKKQFTAAD